MASRRPRLAPGPLTSLPMRPISADEPGSSTPPIAPAIDLWTYLSHHHSAAAAETRAVEEIRRSGLLDADWYCARHPDVAVSGLDPATHYHQRGWREGRAPNAHFDPGFYVGQHPDIGAAGNPLLHYIRHGERALLRATAYFDPGWYRATYPVPDGMLALAHYLERRFSGETSPGPEFDAAWYLRTYADVAAARADPVEHYMQQGYKENRNPSARFDSRFYRLRYLAHAPEANPLLHYLRHRHEPGVHPCMPDGEPSIPREVRRFTAPGEAFEEVAPLPPGLAPRARVLAFYLPQFHAIPENDAAWGRGFTEWTNLARGLPRFAGHYQPRIPRDLGFYSLDQAETLRRQIALASGAGLGGFVFYYYWFNGRRLLDRPLETFLADGGLDFPFCLMWANENWTRRWDGSDDEVLISQDYRAVDEEALLAGFARHFADPRYIRLDGRPLLMIYRPALIPDAGATLARWRARLHELGGAAPVLVMAQSFNERDPRPYGLDGAVEFPPHKLVQDLPTANDRLRYLDPEFSGQVYDYAATVERSLAPDQAGFPLIKTAIPGWDNDARRQGAGLVVHGATPDAYQAWLDALISRAQERPFLGESLVCVNAWNEWAEGAYLEPDVHFGAAFLNATARAIGGYSAARAGAPRLLLVGHDAFPAGAQHLLLHLGRRLRRAHGVRLEILLLGGGALQAAYGELGPVHLADDEPALARVIARVLRGGGLSAALVNTCAAARAVPLLAAAGIETTLLVHEMPGLIAEKALLAGARAGAPAARAVVFPAEIVRDRFLALVPLDPARTCIRPQGVAASIRFDAAARARRRLELGLGTEGVLAIGVGYADLRKGFDLFLQIVRRLQAEPGLRFAWIGAIDPTVQAYLAPEIEALRAVGRLILPGWTEDVGGWLSAADVLLLTSREDPLPSVALEALAVGTPVVAFEGSGGIPELIRRHRAGQVVSMANTEAMAETVRRRRGHAISMRERARLAAVTRAGHDFGAYAETLLGLADPGWTRVSVVIPSYNHAAYLPARLASVWGQTHPVREVVLFDDASDDASVAQARASAAAAERELLIDVAARNSGSAFGQWRRAAARARGDYVWIAESDDAAAPDFLAHLTASLAAAPSAAFAFADSRAIDDEGRPLWPSYQAYYAEAAGPGALSADTVFDGADFARRFLAERNLILNVSAVLWRREALCAALDRCGDELAEYRLAGDWRLYLEALTGGSPCQVAYVAAPLNIHRRHAASVTGRLPAQRHIEEVARLQTLAAARVGADARLRQRQAAYLRTLREQLGAPALPPRRSRRAARN